MAWAKTVTEMLAKMENRWECLRRNADYCKEYEELTKTEDFRQIRATSVITGRASDFCHRWNISFPKNPKQRFRRSKDYALFADMCPVRITLFSRWRDEVYGAFDALAIVQKLLKEGLPPDDAIKAVRRFYELKSAKESKRQNENEITIVVDRRFSRKHIRDYLDRIFSSPLWYENQGKRERVSSREWELMFKAWDLSREGMSHSQIAEELFNRDDAKEFDERTVTNWVHEIDEMIEQINSQKGN